MAELMPRLDEEVSLECLEERPWGRYTVLDEGMNWKVKRIEVLPNCRLSYQRHSWRTEHWLVVEGRANVTIEGETFELCCGEAIDVPLGAAHRVANAEMQPLVFIEVQRGQYCGEDDIIRLQDDFGRS